MKTLKLRIKDKHSKLLTKLAMQVNFVWNYGNALCYTHLQRTGKFFSAYDLHHYTSGIFSRTTLLWGGSFFVRYINYRRL